MTAGFKSESPAGFVGIRTLGAAVGYGLYDIAAILSIVTFATLQLNTAFKG